MKYKIKAMVPVEKRTLFGKKTEYQLKTVEVDRATYKKWKARQKELENEAFLDDMILMDEIFEDD